MFFNQLQFKSSQTLECNCLQTENHCSVATTKNWLLACRQKFVNTVQLMQINMPWSHPEQFSTKKFLRNHVEDDCPKDQSWLKCNVQKTI